MPESLADLTARAGDGAVILLDHAGFARQVFAADVPDDPVAFMGALSQANQLLAPDGHWISLLDLVQGCAPGRAEFSAGGAAPLADLRALFESRDIESAVDRLLTSVRSAASAGMVQVLHLSSPADWIKAVGATPDPELDDLDAEDIVVFQSNLLQRLDLSGIAAVTMDGAYPIAGDLTDICAPMVNFTSHQGLDFAVIGHADALSGELGLRLASIPWENTSPRSGVLFIKVPQGCAPDNALHHINTLRATIGP